MPNIFKDHDTYFNKPLLHFRMLAYDFISNIHKKLKELIKENQ